MAPEANPEHRTEDPIVTKDQKRAQRAYGCIKPRAKGSSEEKEKYSRFAKSFPALVQSSGAAQALAYALGKLGKAPNGYLDDLAIACGEQTGEKMEENTRTAPMIEYQRITRELLAGAKWLKRYAEALLD